MNVTSKSLLKTLIDLWSLHPFKALGISYLSGKFLKDGAKSYQYIGLQNWSSKLPHQYITPPFIKTCLQVSIWLMKKNSINTCFGHINDKITIRSRKNWLTLTCQRGLTFMITFMESCMFLPSHFGTISPIWPPPRALTSPIPPSASPQGTWPPFPPLPATFC